MMERPVDAYGRVIFNGDDAIELLFRGYDITKLHIESNPDIETYNQACLDHDKLDSLIHPIPVDATELETRQSTWWMPAEYQELYVREKLLNMCQHQDEIDRVNLEMSMFDARGLLPVLRLMCFLVDRWREKGVVWGVGRGSSVASYCLFLIGVHRINSIAYNLDISEFLK